MINSNKLSTDSCGMMIQLSDVCTTMNKKFKWTKFQVWKKLFREDIDPLKIHSLINKIEFVNNVQKDEITNLIANSYNKTLQVFDLLNAERIAGHTSRIEVLYGKEILISVDAIYKIEGKHYGIIAKDKYKDRYKKKYLFDMGLSKCSYEGKLACLYLEPKIDGVIFIDLHPFYEPKTDSIEEFIFSHLSLYDLNIKDNLMNLQDIIEDCSKKNKCYFCKFKIFCSDIKHKELIPVTAEINNQEPIKSISLTESQKQFAENILGINRVTALAGSGKTTAVAYRIVNLLNNGYAPEDILCVSFTNTAVQELKSKISSFSNFEVAERCNIYTFHSFCQMILQQHYEVFGYKCVPHIASKTDKLKLLNIVLDRVPKIENLKYEDPLLNLRNAKGALFQIYDYIDEYLKRGFLEDSKLEAQISNISNELNNEMINNNLIDLNTLIYKVNDSNVLNNYEYKHIILDEAQDSSRVQFSILKKLSLKALSLSVIGDIHQSIYAWLYLDVDNLMKFSDNFNSVNDYYFKENFRSTQQIVNVANKFILSGPKIVAFRTGPEPQIIKIGDFSEINDIVKTHNNSENASVAIIARTKNLADMLSLEFNTKSQYLFKNNLVLSITKLAEYLLYGTSQQGILEYLKYCGQLDSNSSIDTITAKYFDKIDEIDNLQTTFASYSNKKRLFLYLLGYLNDSDAVLSNIDFDKFATLEEIYKYLQDSILFDDDTCFSTNNDSNVIFTTVHSSKGCEYDTCIILLDKFTITDEQSMNLLYVAITRAKTNLYFVYKEASDDILNFLQM